MVCNGVFFDLYGTLLISPDMQAAWADWGSALYRFLIERGLALSEEEFTPFRHSLFDRPVPALHDDGMTLYERQLQALCLDLGLSLSRENLANLATTTIGAWQRWIELDQEAPVVLGTLQRDKKLALISNFDHPPHVRALLTDLHLLPFFDAVTISGEVGVKKPDPRIFAFALAVTGLRPEEVVYVGDSIEDVEGARAAGLQPIRIQRHTAYPSPESDQPGNGSENDPFAGVRTIASLCELLAL